MTKKKQKPRTLTIDRNKWLRGIGFENSALWNAEVGAGCCLGHAAHVLDHATWKSLDMVAAPEEKHCAAHAVYDFSRVTITNDDVNLTDAARERQLIKDFKRENITLKFTGPRVASMKRIKRALGLE